MRLRRRNPEERNETSGSLGDGDSEDLRGDAQRLLAAGDEAIERALSANSEAFLAANRQTGGQ